MKRIIFISVVIIICYNGYGQQTPVTNFYNQNLFAVNPGYAGFNGCLEGYMNYRKQWLGFTGSPTTYGLQIHSAIKEKMGVGGSVSMDRLGSQSYLKANGSFAYEIKLNQVNKLRFGIGGGIIQHTLSTAGASVEDQGDPLVGSAVAALSYGGHAGAVFSNDKFIAGIGLPQLYYSKSPFGTAGYRWKQHIILHGSYSFFTSGDLVITPSLLIQSVPLSVIQIEVNPQAVYKDIFMFGLAYRTGAGPSVMLGLYQYKNFTLGYSYEIPFLGNQRYSTGSHEVLLGYKLCKEKGGDADRSIRSRDNY